MAPDFVHLHVHSYYSLLDGLASPKHLISHAKKMGMNALALTDHGVLYGAIEFFEEAKKQGIKPIIGCETYIAPGSRHDKNSKEDARSSHILLLAKNFEGYKNLMKLVTLAHVEGFYYKPRIDWELLKQYSKGLICTSACLIGPLSRPILNGDMKTARETAEKIVSIFDEGDFYLELQHHPDIKEQAVLNKGLIELSKQMNLPLIVTNDVHYAASEDREAHDVLICVQTGSLVTDENRMTYDCDFSLRDPEELAKAFPDHPEALSNTVEIAEKCNLEIPLHQNLLPEFKIETGQTSQEYLRELCGAGLQEKYAGEQMEEAKKQLEYELSMIHKMGFDDYFVIVWDFVKYAKDHDITVGPGRGSAAGSIVSYSLDITTVDPLKFGLVFERFLNPERISMPDIDIDFADDRREEVLEYVTQKYGKRNVAQIITFGTMAAKAAIRDVGRVLGMSYAEVDKIAKLVPMRPGTKLGDAIRTIPELKSIYSTDERMKRLMNLSLKLEGVVRHASTHACAVVISEDDLTNHTPLQYSTKDDNACITQYSMKPIEKIGLLKMDFLGLKNLTILQNAVRLVKKRVDEAFNLDTIPFDDEQTYKLLGEGQTIGVFQLESPGMRKYLKDLQPNHFDDIVAMISLYRPGPMEWISDYIDGKYGKKQITYLHPVLEPILSPTYGIVVYQEQILELAKQFAGFTLGEADVLRRAIGKKIKSELDSQKEKFIEGACKAQNISRELAEKVFSFVEPFANYGFNKSHAVSYAFISYQTAYMKAHYPVEFMAALMSADEDNNDRIMKEVQECREMGIDVLPPSVNESNHQFTPTKSGAIRFGLKAIKNIGDGPIEAIIEAREEGNFETFEDFVLRVADKQVNKKTLEGLAKSGALDSLVERNVVIENLEEILKFSKDQKKSIAPVNQSSLFGETEEMQPSNGTLHLAAAPELSSGERVAWEKEFLGIYLSEHPLDKYKEKTASMRPLHSVTEKDEGKSITVAVVISAIKQINTRTGQPMQFITIEDTSGNIEAIVFPKVMEKYKDIIVLDQSVVIRGKVSFKDARNASALEPKLLISSIELLEDYEPKKRATSKDKSTQEDASNNGEEQHGSSVDPMERDEPANGGQDINEMDTYDENEGPTNSDDDDEAENEYQSNSNNDRYPANSDNKESAENETQSNSSNDGDLFNSENKKVPSNTNDHEYADDNTYELQSRVTDRNSPVHFDDTKNRLYISIPKTEDLSIVHSIKELLEKSPGSSEVVMRLFVDGEERNLKLSLTITFSSELSERIQTLIHVHAHK